MLVGKKYLNPTPKYRILRGIRVMHTILLYVNRFGFYKACEFQIRHISPKSKLNKARTTHIHQQIDAKTVTVKIQKVTKKLSQKGAQTRNTPRPTAPYLMDGFKESNKWHETGEA